MDFYRKRNRKQRLFIKFFIQAAVLFMIIVGVSYCSSTYNWEFDNNEERTALFLQKAEIMLEERGYEIVTHIGSSGMSCNRFVVQKEAVFDSPTEVKVCPRGEGNIYVRGEDGYE